MNSPGRCATTDDRIYQYFESISETAHSLWTDLGVIMSFDAFAGALIFTTRDYGSPTARQFLNEYADSVETTGDECARMQRFMLIRLSCAYLGEALRYADDGYRDDAWESLLLAQYAVAKLSGFIAGENENPKRDAMLKEMAKHEAQRMISERARKAADKTHEGNRATRDEAFKWLDEHFEKRKLTNDRAAELLGDVVSKEFSTRLSYVKKWKQSRQSASRLGCRQTH
ncbi:hypothetical protein AWB80_03373 [Caballeronia pedi]|uniref:Uncharacterized protein n=1 Tax=Caballeronia pedi TaxID=1777141 RepID=A0A158BD53_9BURK|nr:hypothetical protein [Caballeronia pedi]SAK67953.1 hypothetical protein AWB80_03373 [Caballeronia pedi]